MKQSKNILVILLLLSAAAFSIFKYLTVLKERDNVLGSLAKVKIELTGLEAEKQSLIRSLEEEKEQKGQLTEQNKALKENLETYAEQLAQLEEGLVQAQNVLRQLSSQFAILKAENTALQEEKISLKDLVVRLSQENAEYGSRFNSVSELKKAIGDLKTKMRQAKRKIKNKSVALGYIEGNKGFVVWDGKSTHPAQVKIEVEPVWPKEMLTTVTE